MKHLLKALVKEKVLIEKHEKKKKKEPIDKPSITHHAIEINGRSLKFTATAGCLDMKDEKGKLKSRIFFVSYEKDGVSNKSSRPITFAFNGGPGCSSIWLHVAAMGPKRVRMSDEGEVFPPPYKFEDNQFTWLDFTDLVFVDPIGTGFSRPAKDEDEKQFFGLKEDVQWVGEFIRLYITKNKRWSSPKFLAGESYGTTRAAKLTGFLHDKFGIELNGIILISSVLDFQTITFNPGNDLPYILFLPGYAATAWYHKKIAPPLQENLQKTLEEVEKWVIEEYLVALAKGDSIPDTEKDKIIEKLSLYTGLSKKFIKNCNMRIQGHRFCKELLRDENRTIGRLDSRYKGIDADSAGEQPEYDPSFSKAPFVAAVNDFVRTELKYENDLPYAYLSMEAHNKWNWISDEKSKIGYPNVAETLRQRISENKYLKVFIACGIYDLGTPYFGAKFTASHMGLDPTLRNNLTLAYYEAGHMMYYHLPSMKKLKEDVERFYEGILKELDY